MSTVRIDLDDDLIALLSQGFESVPRAVLELTVMELYRRDSLSAEEAAAALGMAPLGFTDHATGLGLPPIGSGDEPDTGGPATAPAARGSIGVDDLDHLVLTVASIERTRAFYVDVLGMRANTFDDGRTALHFGARKINLHPAGQEFEPKARHPTPGSADLCFLTRTPLPEVIAHLQRRDVAIELGPVRRSGAMGPLTSIYLRDPDGNLIELANRDG